MKISRRDVEHVALLARLQLTEEEIELYTKHLSAVIEYADKLQTVDTENVKPTAHAVPLQNVFREDVVEPSMDRDALLRNAPDSENGFFKVPKIV